jgi:hypothetical protein
MVQEIFPPLPDPAENQPPEARRAMGQRLIKQARFELESGDRLQAGGKAWGAAVQYLKIIGEQRRWGHESNRQLQSLGRHLAAEFPEYGGELSGALADAYFKGHENFYENRRRLREVLEAVEGIEETIPILELIADAPPRPFTIASNSQLRRLRVLTGRDELQVGDSSEVGFSLQDGYSRSHSEERAVRESGLGDMPTLQDIVRGLMQALMEDYPRSLTQEDLNNLEDRDYCRETLRIRGLGVPILRKVERGPQISGHNRYWTRPYGGKYLVTKEWWAIHHPHNAASLGRWLEQLIARNPSNPEADILRQYRDALRLYSET